MDTVLQIGLSNAVVASVLALVAMLFGFFYRRPALIHGLWLLVLLKLLTPPLVPIPIAWPVVAEPVAEASPAASPSDMALSSYLVIETTPDFDEAPNPVVGIDAEAVAPIALAEAPPPLAVAPASFAWQALVAGVWLTGSVGWFLLAGLRVCRFRRCLRYAVPAPPSLQRLADRLVLRMKLPACPTICLIPGRLAPMLWAIGGKPLLLVPRELLTQLTEQQQETLLAHELAHLRRRDHWVRGLEFLAMGLYWWHPVVWFARRELREAEEQCCDAWVVSLLPGAGKTYATALLETLDFLSDARPATPLLASGIGHVSDLKRRLTMIMSGTTPRSLSWRGTFAVLVLGLVALPLLPTLVQAQTKELQAELEKQLAQLRFEVGKNEDSAVVQADLAKAQEELAKLQKELKVKQEQIQALQARIAAMKGGKKTDEGKPGVMILQLDNGEIMKILLPDVKKEAPQQGKIRWLSDDTKKPNEIVLRKVGDKWEVVSQPVPPKPPAPAKPPVHAVPFEGIQFPAPKLDGLQIITQPNPSKPGAEGRIENLERQLKQIMKELEALRKEVKPQKSTTAAPAEGGLQIQIDAPLSGLILDKATGTIKEKTPEPKKVAPKP